MMEYGSQRKRQLAESVSHAQLRQSQVKGQRPSQLALCSVPQQFSRLSLQGEEDKKKKEAPLSFAES